MSDITTVDVQKLARLARLKLSEAELRRFTKEFTAILNYFAILAEADTEGLKPTYQVTGLANVMRPDEEIDYGASKVELMKNLPACDGDYIKVKRMLG